MRARFISSMMSCVHCRWSLPAVGLLGCGSPWQSEFAPGLKWIVGGIALADRVSKKKRRGEVVRLARFGAASDRVTRRADATPGNLLHYGGRRIMTASCGCYRSGLCPQMGAPATPCRCTSSYKDSLTDKKILVQGLGGCSH